MEGNELSQKLEIFRNLLHPSLQDLITISARYNLKDDWPKTWPDNEKPGVYVLLDEQKEILYIGKSSVCIGSRLNAHFHYAQNRNECIPYSDALSNIRFIWTVGFPRDKWFLSTALEEFLIAELDPKLNKVGRIT
jgi:excinuclease UvrABC nuclease subunit